MDKIKKNLPMIIITLLLSMLPLFVGLILWNRLPDRIPTHFNMHGVADQYSSKAFTVFVFPLIMLGVYLMSLFATASDPKHSHISDRVFRLVLWIVPIVALYMTVMVYGKALQYEVDITRASFILMAVIFIIVGNYLPKSRQNYTVGIKTRWALDDPENWDRTHRFGGYVFMVGGFLILILAILPTLLPYAVLIVAACIGILPTIYSFLFYLKKQK